MPLIYYIPRRDAATGTVSLVVDTNFSQTSLLLSPSMLTTTSFATDASTNGHEVTVVGDTKPSNFNPHASNWSLSLNGATSYTAFGNNASFTFGTGDFTVEAWVYFTADTLFSIFNVGGANTGSYALYRQANKTLQSVRYGDAGNSTSTSTLLNNKWYHIAAVRASGTAKIFIDGIEEVSAGYSMGDITAETAESGRTFLNTENGASFGNISNLRVVKGTAVYSANFTPPTSPLTAIPNTSLLTFQSSRVVDNSSNAFAIANFGDVEIKSFSPFVSSTSSGEADKGSGYFDGSFDYLEVTSPSVLSSSATIECWIYMTEIPYDGNKSVLPRLQSIATAGNGSFSSDNNDHNWFFIVGATTAYFGKNPSLLSWPTSLIPINQWHHVAVTISGTVGEVYINGVLAATQNSMTALGTNSSYTTKIGTGLFGDGAGLPSFFKGYISNFRIVSGTVLYSSNFSVPSAPLAAVANTSILTLQTAKPHNNNCFVNSAPRTKELQVAKFGNTTQGSMSPFSASWSGYFDGTGDYLSVANNAAFNFGTGDFTVECHASFSSTSSTQGLVSNYAGATEGWYIQWKSDTASYVFGLGDTPLITFSSTPALNQWIHIAITRSGTSLSMFLNGVLVATTTNSTSLTSTNPLVIGTLGGLQFYTGNISNVRIVKGTALYTENFTPSNAPLTAIAGTSLLTCQNDQFIDNSSNRFALTATGTPTTTLNNISSFALNTLPTPKTYSVYFNGTTGYLTGTFNNVGSTPFTLEMWVYKTVSGTVTTIFDGRSTIRSVNGFAIQTDSSNRITFQWDGQTIFTTSNSITINAWNHIAIVGRTVQSNQTLFAYINGTEGVSTLVGANFSETSLTIGNNISRNAFFPGYISNLRIVRGTAVYTTNFTPSTEPLTAIAGTSLLTCQDQELVDNSSNAFTMVSVADAKPSSVNPFGFNESSELTGYSQSKFSGSAYFAGAGDYLSVPDDVALEFGNSNLTWEMWINTRSTTTFSWLYARFPTSLDAGMWALITNLSAAGDVALYLGDNSPSNPVLGTNGGLVNDGAWHHIAVVRNGSAWVMYVDGISRATATWEGTISDISSGTTIGGGPTIPYGNHYTGYISNVRITNGTAVYTSNFLPSAAPLTATSNTTLLLKMDSASIVDATGLQNIETVGDVKITNKVVKYGTNSMYFDGVGDYLSMPALTSPVANEDFTIECWYYPIAKLTNYPSIYANYITYSASAIALWDRHDSWPGKFNLQCGAVNATSTTTVTNGIWYHIAATRTSGVIKLYINGVLEATTSGANSSNVPTVVRIGAGDNASLAESYLNGYLSDFRVTKGSARYTANFTPPAAALPIA